MLGNSRGGMEPAQAMYIFGLMILVVSGITLFAFSHLNIGQSADFGAVDFDETNSGEIQITVMETGSVERFTVEENGNIHTLDAEPGASITVNSNSVTVYGVNSEGEETKVDSYTT